jgi:hypothetical protein
MRTATAAESERVECQRNEFCGPPSGHRASGAPCTSTKANGREEQRIVPPSMTLIVVVEAEIAWFDE